MSEPKKESESKKTTPNVDQVKWVKKLRLVLKSETLSVCPQQNGDHSSLCKNT